MLDLEMLNTMRRAGMLAASDDLRDGMPFDGAYVQDGPKQLPRRMAGHTIFT
jgi:hypothetical protein